MFRQVLIIIGAMCLSLSIGFCLPFVMADQAPTLQVDEDALKEQFKLELAESMKKRIAKEEADLRLELEEQWEAFAVANPDLIQEYLDGKNALPEVVEVAAVDTESSVDESAATNKSTISAHTTAGNSAAANSTATTTTNSTTTSETSSAVTTETNSAATTTTNTASSTTEEDLIDIVDEASVPLAPMGGEEEVVVETSTPIAPVGTPMTEVFVKDAWINEQIARHRAKIADADLLSGSEIYNQLDTTYLFGLAREGLTTDEETEAKAYLKANLNAQELTIAQDLYYKYVHLLE